MLKSKFLLPPSENHPGYFWLLNAELNKDILHSQLQAMHDAGIHSICICSIPKKFRDSLGSTMNEEYLSDEYMDAIKFIFDECRELDIIPYLYDEGGWPSGGACGQVWELDPEKYSRSYLLADGKDKVRLEKLKPKSNAANYPDILIPEVTEKFIELTHERFLSCLGKERMAQIKFAFTDEPSYMTCTPARLSWTADLAEEFKKRKGYDLLPWLPKIMELTTREDEIAVRIDYHDVLSQLFVERYLIPIRTWCREHDILSSGHFNGEDEPERMMFLGFGHFLRSLRAMDAPGIDVIWRQLWQGERLHEFPKYASSAASHIGKRCVFTEMFGVYGAGLTLEQIKFNVGYMIVCGVNTFTFGGYPLSTQGQRMLSVIRPFYNELNPQWKYLSELNQWCARLSVLATDSLPEVHTALFFDAHSLWAHPRIASYANTLRIRISDALLESQRDFDYVDDDLIAEATVESGKLRMGEALYTRLVIPTCARLAPEAKANLEKLKAAGAEIISSDEIHTIAPTVKLNCQNFNFRVRKHRTGDGSSIYFVLNTAFSPQRFSAAFDETSSGGAADAATGNIYALTMDNGNIDTVFAPGELKVFVFGTMAADALPAPALPGEEISSISGNWKIKKLNQTIIGDENYQLITFTDAPEESAETCDWKSFLGKDFSGEAEYSIDFDFSGNPADAGFLDLGTVKYSATAILNGVELGQVFAQPYIFPLKNALRAGSNTLRVRVSNTLANLVAQPEVLEKWQKTLPFETIYEKITRLYEPESFPSGLFGPVTLKKEK